MTGASSALLVVLAPTSNQSQRGISSALFQACGFSCRAPCRALFRRRPCSATAAYSLRTGLLVSGKLLQPNTLPVGNASVQILCSLCIGLERDRPLAEASSDPGGNFVLAIPDPGTM